MQNTQKHAGVNGLINVDFGKNVNCRVFFNSAKENRKQPRK